MRRLIRGILSGIAFSVFGVGALSIGLTLLPFIAIFVRDPVRRKYLSAKVIKYSWMCFVRIMEFFRLIKVDIDRDALQDIRGSIIVANHPSLIDVVILVSVLPDPICVIKGDIKNNFFMKHVVLNTYIANSEQADEFIEDCSNVLNEGYNLIIFPEGTRTRPDRESKLHRGAAYVAMNTEAPILPVHIELSEPILGKHQKFFDVSDKRVTYRIKPKNPIELQHVISAADSSRNNARKLTELIKLNIEK